MTGRDSRKSAEGFESLTAEVGKVIVGQKALVERILVGLLAGSRVPVEAVAGRLRELDGNYLHRVRHATPVGRTSEYVSGTTPALDSSCESARRETLVNMSTRLSIVLSVVAVLFLGCGSGGGQSPIASGGMSAGGTSGAGGAATGGSAIGGTSTVGTNTGGGLPTALASVQQPKRHRR